MEIFYKIQHQKMPNTVTSNKRKTTQRMVLASKRVQFIMLPQVATIKIINRNYAKEVAKQLFRSASATTKRSFKMPLYKHYTKLSTEYMKLKIKQLKQEISMKIKGVYKSYNSISKCCNLCLTKKLKILDNPDITLLDKR